MSQINYNYYLNNILVPAPENWQELEVELSFENNAADASVRSSAFTWKGTNAAIINKWFSGPLGIWEGIPFKIQLCNTQDIVFNGIVDLTQEGTLFSCDIVKIKCRDQRIDMVNDLMKSISFGYLWQGSYTGNATGLATMLSNAASGFSAIQTNQFIAIPYVRSQIPDWFQVGTFALSFYTMIQKLYETVVQLAKLIAELASTVFTALGIIELVALLLQLILMVVACINLSIALYENMIGDIRYKYGMKAIDLINSFCSYFGIQFQSSIFASGSPYANLVIMPKKTALPTFPTFAGAFFGINIQRKQYDEALNANAYGYYEGTPWDLMQQLAEMFNAKCKVITNSSGQQVLTFERWDYYYNKSSYKLPNISSQAPFVDYYETNASELAANYFLQYQIDTQDNNTLDDYTGTNTQVVFSSKKVGNTLNNTRQNLTTVSLQFAHATRKNSISAIEGVWDGVYNVIAGLYTALTIIPNTLGKWITGKNIYPPMTFNPLQSRVGMMLLSSDMTGMQKIFVGDILPANQFSNGCRVGMISVNNRNTTSTVYPQGFIGCQTLIQNYHFSNFVLFPNAPAPYNATYLGATYYNQYKVYKDKPIPVCCADFQSFRNNNWITDYNNMPTRIDSIPWNPYKNIAKTNYRTLFQYDFNTNYTLIVDGN